MMQTRIQLSLLLLLPCLKLTGNWNTESILLHQRSNGGWPKNFDREKSLTDKQKKQLIADKAKTDTGFDNGATHSEVRHLAKLYLKNPNIVYQSACLRGINFMLSAQYPNGGWPQFYPLGRGYSRHITFNDGAMIGVMRALKDITSNTKDYPFVDEMVREQCRQALARGLQCILDSQIIVNGRKTAWCAQHDEKTLAPRKARSYELASLSGGESVGIVQYLMSIDDPSPAVIESIQSAVAWFESAKLEGIRQVRKAAKDTPKGFDKIIIQDPTAPPIWARFYSIANNQPIFCSRDGKPKKKLSEISYERRNGYSWLGYYATDLLSKSYPEWQTRWALDKNILIPE